MAAYAHASSEDIVLMSPDSSVINVDVVDVNILVRRKMTSQKYNMTTGCTTTNPVCKRMMTLGLW